MLTISSSCGPRVTNPHSVRLKWASQSPLLTTVFFLSKRLFTFKVQWTELKWHSMFSFLSNLEVREWSCSWYAWQHWCIHLELDVQPLSGPQPWLLALISQCLISMTTHINVGTQILAKYPRALSGNRTHLSLNTQSQKGLMSVVSPKTAISGIWSSNWKMSCAVWSNIWFVLKCQAPQWHGCTWISQFPRQHPSWGPLSHHTMWSYSVRE